MHLWEKWVSNLAISLSNAFSNLSREDEDLKCENENFGSFFIWNKSKQYDPKDLDPNYVALKKWLFGINPGIAPFHIDIHGKFH